MSGHTKRTAAHGNVAAAKRSTHGADELKKPALTDDEVKSTVDALEWLLDDPSGLPPPTSDRFYDATMKIYVAVVHDPQKRLSAHERLDRFDAGIKALAPLFAQMRETDANRAILSTKILVPAREKRDALLISVEKENQREAGDEVDTLAATLAGSAPSGKEFVAKDEDQEKAILSATIHKAIGLSQQLHDMLGALTSRPNLDERVLEEVNEMSKGKRALAAEGAVHALSLVDGLLTLSSDEFQKEMAKGFNAGVMGTMRSMSELTGKTLETMNALMQVVSKGGALVASVLGSAGTASQLVELGEFAEKTLGKTAAAVGMVHGLFTALDPRSNATQRMDGAVEIASAGFALAGEAGPGAIITGWWLGIKTVSEAYLQAVESFKAAALAYPWPNLGTWLEHIGHGMDKLSAAGILGSTARDDAAKARYDAIATEAAADVGVGLDRFLHEVSSIVGWESGGINNLGDAKVMRREWDAYLPLAGKRTREEVVPAAEKILHKILWCFEHAEELFKEQMSGDVKKEAKERRKEEKEEIWEQEMPDMPMSEYIGGDVP